jgi:hypothetical protein
MQTMAVLLLEMAYEGKHLKEEKESIIQCLKKMIAWLRAMQVNDPVAARAYEVVFKILKTCAPALREQVKSLFEDDLDSEFPIQDAAASRDSIRGSSSGSWNQAGYADYPSGSHEGFPAQVYQEPLMDPLYSCPPVEQQPMAYAFGNPFFTSFDQGVPLIDMQSLWWQSASSGDTSIETPGIALSQQQLMQGQMQQQMHEEMQQADREEQPARGGDWDYPPYQ